MQVLQGLSKSAKASCGQEGFRLRILGDVVEFSVCAEHVTCLCSLIPTSLFFEPRSPPPAPLLQGFPTSGEPVQLGIKALWGVVLWVRGYGFIAIGGR